MVADPHTNMKRLFALLGAGGKQLTDIYRTVITLTKMLPSLQEAQYAKTTATTAVEAFGQCRSAVRAGLSRKQLLLPQIR